MKYTITLDLSTAATDEDRSTIVQAALGQTEDILVALAFGAEGIDALPASVSIQLQFELVRMDPVPVQMMLSPSLLAGQAN